MPEIIGKFSSVHTSLSKLDAHVGHLHHLTNQRIARGVLRERHQLTAVQAKEIAKQIGPHISQALNFHDQSRKASAEIRPVLQYYCYLNLAVAAILTMRPPNLNQYRRHGVEDRTHRLTKLELGSILLKVNRGAVPLFHSIFSDVPLYNKTLRFGQLAAGFHMFAHELSTQFDRKIQNIDVTDEVQRQDENEWISVFSFSEKSINNVLKKVPFKKLEDAMPLLVSNYDRDNSDVEKTIYRSNYSWSTEESAIKAHRENGLKLINYGGHESS